MKIPKHIVKALNERERNAIDFTINDQIIYEFLEENSIVVQEYDILSGCESIYNPQASCERIKKSILAK